MKYKLIFFFNISLKSNFTRFYKILQYVCSMMCHMQQNDGFNPIPAGVLENQDTLGGSLWPPPLNPMFDVQIWQMMHHWKACALLLESAKKMCKSFLQWIGLSNLSSVLVHISLILLIHCSTCWLTIAVRVVYCWLKFAVRIYV